MQRSTLVTVVILSILGGFVGGALTNLIFLNFTVSRYEQSLERAMNQVQANLDQRAAPTADRSPEPAPPRPKPTPAPTPEPAPGITPDRGIAPDPGKIPPRPAFHNETQL